MEILEFSKTVQDLLQQKQNWFNTQLLQDMLNEYRILQACVKNINDLLVKKSLIIPDPYKLDKRISDIVVPETSSFPDSEIANQLGARFSDYDVMLDFICTYYSFTVENLSIPRIKKLLEFNKVVDWKNLYSNTVSSNSHALGVCLTSAKRNSPSVIVSLVNDSVTKAAECTDKINGMLNELGVFQRELYKGELRQDIFNHPEFNSQKAFSSDSEEMAEIKRLFSKVIGKRKPFYNELVQEIINEDQGANKEKLQEVVLKRLEIKDSNNSAATKKKAAAPNAKKMLMDTVFCLGAIAPTLQQFSAKLNENFDVLFTKKKNFFSILGTALKRAFKVPEKERVVEVSIMDSTGHSRSQKVKVNELNATISQKTRIYNAIASKGAEYSKIEASEETAILNFLNKQISECQALFSILNACDTYLKNVPDPTVKVKMKGMSLELSTFKSSVMNVNKKRGEYMSFKEETEQMKKLGISND